MTWILGLSAVLLFIIVWMLSAPVQATSRPPALPVLDTRNVSSIARYQGDLDASQTQVWIHTTRADWEGGARELMDSITISGSLQLAQRRFSDNTTLTPRDELDAGKPQPHIAADTAGNAYAVWEDYRNGNRDIYFAYRPISGTWSTNIQVSDDTGTADQRYPAIAARHRIG